MRFRPYIGGIAAALVLASVASAGAHLRVDDAWIRWLPAGVPAGGYAKLSNLGDTPVALLAATSSAYAEISIHRSAHRGGAVQMEPVKEIIIDSHSTLDFESAGYHLMLMKPVGSQEHAPQVDVTLHFGDGTSMTVPFRVRLAGTTP